MWLKVSKCQVQTSHWNFEKVSYRQEWHYLVTVTVDLFSKGQLWNRQHKQLGNCLQIHIFILFTPLPLKITMTGVQYRYIPICRNLNCCLWIKQSVQMLTVSSKAYTQHCPLALYSCNSTIVLERWTCSSPLLESSCHGCFEYVCMCRNGPEAQCRQYAGMYTVCQQCDSSPI